MDTYETDPIKIEKKKAMRRYQTFRKIATIIRTFEIVIAISLTFWSVSRSSVYIPIAVKFNGDILRRSFSLLFSPHFVFLIGNLIVFTLFLNSGCNSINSGGEVEKEEREAEIAVVEEKKKEEKCYRRTKSEVKAAAVVKKELRRSETEPRRRIENGESESESEAVMNERLRRRLCEEDELSGEEFRRKVEKFIEKQQRFLREESISVVLSSNYNNINNNNQCNSM